LHGFVKTVDDLFVKLTPPSPHALNFVQFLDRWLVYKQVF
jgi:hypothetical protein